MIRYAVAGQGLRGSGARQGQVKGGSGGGHQQLIPGQAPLNTCQPGYTPASRLTPSILPAARTAAPHLQDCLPGLAPSACCQVRHFQSSQAPPSSCCWVAQHHGMAWDGDDAAEMFLMVVCWPLKLSVLTRPYVTASQHLASPLVNLAVEANHPRLVHSALLG